MAAALTQINGYAHVATRYGFEEAVFLHSLMFWYRTNRANDRNFRDGRWWTYNSVKAFEEVFPWWNGGQIRRIIIRCREKGALLDGNYSEDRRDRTAWYSPSDELLELYGDLEIANCICRKRQMQLPESSSSSDENGKCNIRNTCSNHGETDSTPYSPPAGGGAAPADAHSEGKPQPRRRRARQKKSIPTYAPERFEQFWKKYPVSGSRLKAVEEWDALAPDDALIDEMARALARQMHSKMWRDGIGIPHACRWLRDQRWTDKPPEKPQAGESRIGDSRRWDPLPEVDE